MRKVRVMVTGLGGGGHGEQIFKALRLASTPYEIVGADMSPYSKGLLEADHPYILPPASDSAYMGALLAVCRKHQVEALFHGSEPELKEMSKHRKMIQDEGLFLPINPEHVIETCMNKTKTMNWLVQKGFACPTTVGVSSIRDLEAIAFLPAVLKPAVGSGGSTNVYLAQTRDELIAFGKHLLSIYPEFIAQEYVGTPDSEYTVGVLTDMDGNLINSIAVRRVIMSGLSNRTRVPNRTGNKRLGPVLALSSGISQGEVGPFPEVTLTCEKIALALGCRPVVNLQCRYVEGRVQVFEINPRFSGTTSLRAMVGFNEPDILIRKHVLKEQIAPRFEYRSGVIMRGLVEAFTERSDVPAAIDLVRSNPTRM
jgi:carbamoyl-phosphate synthase large subunit